jgi:hypothetical protein
MLNDVMGSRADECLCSLRRNPRGLNKDVWSSVVPYDALATRRRLHWRTKRANPTSKGNPTSNTPMIIPKLTDLPSSLLLFSVELAAVGSFFGVLGGLLGGPGGWGTGSGVVGVVNSGLARTSQ